jgi:hypothetical protein
MSEVHPIDQDVVTEERRAAVLAELARIIDSPSFRGSRRCCRLLEYSVHQVLKGCAQEELKERTIGIEALQRLPDYDTGEDAIVRVTANEVRKRLAQFYQGSDIPGNPAISLPAGSYAVTFQWQPPVVGPPVEPAPVTQTPSLPYRKLVVGLALVVIAAVALAFWFWPVRGRIAAPGARVAPAQSLPAKGDPLWSRVFSPGQKTNIVVSDKAYRDIQYFLGRDLSLSEYLAPGYPDSLTAAARPEMRSVIAFLSEEQTTSVGSATLGARLFALGIRVGGVPVIRYPRHINAREFQTDSFILIGSRLSLPWAELFDPSLTFSFTTDPATHTYFLRNRSPRPGERAEYRQSKNGEETWADIAVLPNLAGTGTVLMLNGIDMEAAEAAGEFAINGSLSAKLSARSRFTEVLVHVKSIGGTVARVEVAATRDAALRNLPAEDGTGR